MTVLECLTTLLSTKDSRIGQNLLLSCPTLKAPGSSSHAMTTKKNVTIYEQWADSIVDAIIFANHISNSQYWTRIPKLDGRFGSQYSILTVSRHHFLLFLSQPKPSLTASLKIVARTHAHNTRSKVKSRLIPGITLLSILLIPNAVLS